MTGKMGFIISQLEGKYKINDKEINRNYVGYQLSAMYMYLYVPQLTLDDSSWEFNGDNVMKNARHF